MRLLDGRDQVPDLALHLRDATGGPIGQVLLGIRAGNGLGKAAQVDLGAEAGMDGVAARDGHGRPRAGELEDLGELLPHHAGDRPGAIAEQQPQIVPAVSAPAHLGLLDQQDLIDLHAVCQLVEEHDLKVKMGADGPLGAPDPAVDGFETSAAEVAALHAQGKHVVCYVDVGTAESFRRFEPCP